MARQYYVALFNSNTWVEFLENNAKMYGTTKNKESRAKKIKKGDYLICYISQMSTISGLLEVYSESYSNNSTISTFGSFPVTFDVKPLAILDPENVVPIHEAKLKLIIFQKLYNPLKWGGFFINALNEFPKEDGKWLSREIKRRAKKQVENSIDEI
jgi:predicted RNA-binding protein